MKKMLAIALMLSMGALAWGNGLSLNSVGTRSIGMGGAYVAYAADGSAVYWNPAGLAGQPTSIMFAGSAIMPSGTYKYDAAGIDATMKSNTYLVPNLFFTYNMDELAFSLSVYTPAGLGAEWDGKDLTAFTGGVGPYEWMSKLGAVAIAPAVAYQISDQFSVGVAANIYYAMFDMDRADAVEALPGVDIPVQYHESSTGTGFSATVGLKFDVNKDISLGATFRTSTTVSMSGDATYKNTHEAAVPIPYSTKSSFDRDVTWPMWIAGGIAYKGIDHLVLTADAQYTAWSELDVLKAKYNDFGVTGDFNMYWEDAVQLRAGAEYMLSDAFAARVGYYYDPAPAPDKTLNFLFPSSTNNVFTAGCTYMTGKLSFDFGLEYLLGAERDVTAAPDNMPGKHKLDIFVLAVGLGYAL